MAAAGLVNFFHFLRLFSTKKFFVIFFEKIPLSFSTIKFLFQKWQQEPRSTLYTLLQEYKGILCIDARDKMKREVYYDHFVLKNGPIAVSNGHTCDC